MSLFNRAAEVDRKFVAFLRGGIDDAQPSRPHPYLSNEKLAELVDSQLICRHLDLKARLLRAEDEAFYTIASCGHVGDRPAR